MTVTAASLKRDFAAVLKSGTTPAAIAVRAALGAGAASVIPVDALRGALPAAPFIAVGFGPVNGAPLRDLRILYPTLWLYDDAGQRWYRLNDLAALVEAAFPEDGLTAAITRMAGLGQEFTDEALNRPALAMRYEVKGRF